MSGIFDLFKNNDCSCNSRGKGIKLDPVTIIICNLCKKRSELKKTLKINKTEKYFCSEECWSKWLSIKRNWFRY